MNNFKYTEWAEMYPNHMVLKKEGYFYSVHGAGAVVLANIMGYRIGTDQFGYVTGSPVIENMADELKDRQIDFIVIAENEIKEEYTSGSMNYQKLCSRVEPIPYLSEDEKMPDEISDEDAELLTFIEQVLQGVDPNTGEIYNQDTLVCSLKMKESLMIAKKTILKGYLKKKQLPEGAGGKWSEEEDAQLETEVNQNMPIEEIAEIHKRTIGAIRSRIHRKFPNMVQYG